ncbi:MAG TPA: hypothetical protein VMW17_15035 [Candidatus Binatia bacterium]|nr:hypothetical protein [Candidatus Binatia bacterium]
MRDRRRLFPLLFIGSLMSSCTCHRQVEEAPNPSALSQRHVGFDTGGPSTGGSLKLGEAPAAPEMPPTPNQVPQAPEGNVAEIPPDFPSDVQLMQDAELAAVHPMAQGAHAVLVRTEQDMSQMYNFYQSDLKAKGWTLEQNYQAKDQAFLGFRRGNTILSVTFAKDPSNPSKRLVNIMYQEDQKPEFDEF